MHSCSWTSLLVLKYVIGHKCCSCQDLNIYKVRYLGNVIICEIVLEVLDKNGRYKNLLFISMKLNLVCLLLWNVESPIGRCTESFVLYFFTNSLPFWSNSKNGWFNKSSIVTIFSNQLSKKSIVYPLRSPDDLYKWKFD